MIYPRWTEEQDRRLIELWRNSSVTEICLSGEFNGYSRSAILGRVFRLRKKWGTDMVPFKDAGRPVLAQKKKRVRKRSFNINDGHRVLVREPTLVKTPPAPAQARRIPLLELGKTDCRFIVTGNDTREHLYCALDASAFVDNFGNGCYCAYHRRIMRASHPR